MKCTDSIGTGTPLQMVRGLSRSETCVFEVFQKVLNKVSTFFLIASSASSRSLEVTKIMKIVKTQARRDGLAKFFDIFTGGCAEI